VIWWGGLRACSSTWGPPGMHPVLNLTDVFMVFLSVCSECQYCIWKYATIASSRILPFLSYSIMCSVTYET
jgi:hypothetical protein